MYVVFTSNFLSEHQLPFCLAMYELTDGHFSFIANEQIDKERIDLGFKDIHKDYPFVIRAYETEAEAKRAHTLALDCDMLIYGSAPVSYLNERIKKGGFVFCYSERLYKKGKWQALSPRGLLFDLTHYLRWRNKPVYLLCASAYAAHDYSLHRCFINKTYKWGYFPTVIKKDIDTLLEQKNANPRPEILWVGRLIDWKHPEAAIALCEKLCAKKKDFHITIIGCGNMEQTLREFVTQKNLNPYISFSGAQPPASVREYMDESDIFITTSDQNEGWGAVLNEAMNSACAVVASNSTGAAPFLIRSGINGLLFRNCDWDDLSEKVIQVLDDRTMREEFGRKAYESILGIWNAETAAKRVVQIYNWLSKKTAMEPEFSDGPCSKADRHLYVTERI